MSKPKVLIILSSVREGRVGEGIANWVAKVAQNHPVEMDYELVDLKDFNFPNYTDPRSASQIKAGEYGSELANQWAEKVEQADGFMIVTPEYNHSFPGALKNALDVIYSPWNNKPVAFVSYGASAGGSRAVEQLRLVAAELQMADIRLATHIVGFYLPGVLDEAGMPQDIPLTKGLEMELDQLGWWTKALQLARQ